MEAYSLAERLRESIDGSGEPISGQIVDNIWLAVVDGSLEVGERLPTARELAIGLRVSPRAVEHAYAELERRGVVAHRAGEGTFVCLAQPPEEELSRRRELTALCADALERARMLGFGLEELMDALAEYRDAESPRS